MTTVKLSGDLINDRKNWAFRLAKFLSVSGYKALAKPHLEFHENLLELKKKKSVFLYASLHKSLWETTGILAALYLEKLPIPYTGMGDNLVVGKFFQSLAQKVGVFLIKRPGNRAQMLESARMLKDYTINYLAHGEDVMLFPEGTRKSILSQGEYGKFFPTAFEALLGYEKNKEKILEEYPRLEAHDSYIIPTNVDYSKIREGWEMLKEYKGKPRTLTVLDSLKMVRNIGDTYLSYGNPIKVADHLDMSRKQLADLTREKCLELVKILPINVVARSIVDSVDGDRIDTGKIADNIAGNVRKLSSLSDRFRGFTPADDPMETWRKVTAYESYFKEKYIDIKYLEFYRLYANYIGHYFK
jgi:1-acyl-sn-glycerol-3-phosphate acyltransferase